MSQKLAEDFDNFCKTNLEGKIDQFSKEGTQKIFDQVMNKEKKSSPLPEDS